MLEYQVKARRLDAHGATAETKTASITLDTDVAGRTDAFNPAELLLAAIAACMIKGAERVAPMIKFELRGMEVRVHGVRQDAPPKRRGASRNARIRNDDVSLRRRRRGVRARIRPSLPQEATV